MESMYMSHPTFSIISVYNNKHTLSEFLLSGLEQQSFDDFEKIMVDNRDNEYESAASALNEGAEQATGEYLIFIHQDVKLPESYLSEAAHYLKEIDDLGVAGATGVRKTGECSAVGMNTIKHGKDKRSWERGTEISKPTEVDTLDELLLIIPQSVFNEEPFSTNLCKGWHLYGVEYCIRMKRAGASVKVLPMSLWHYSDGGWRNWKHDITLSRLIRAYPNLSCIHTTGGSWPASQRYVIWRLLNQIPVINIPTRLIRSVKNDGLSVTIQKIRQRLG
jgi:GT2 family glycosyltransferase